MALTSLPEEVLELIVHYLNVKDLLACSAVSTCWREKFNNDLFWKNFCIRDIADYLENVQCQVEPAFDLPQQNEERLQYLCSWRINYMRKTHLLNNWKTEKFVSSEIRPYSGVVSCDVKCDCEGSHWLFIRTKCKMEIWNINFTPQLYVEIPIFLDCPNISSYIAGKRAVVTQWNMCTVFDLKNHNQSRDVLRFLVDESQVLAPSLSSDKKEIEYINEIDDFRFHTFTNILVGHKRIPNPVTDLSMHIWDVSTGEKINIESMLNKLVDFDEISYTNIFTINEHKGLIRLLFLLHDNELYSQLFMYDFKKCKFADLNIMFEGVVVWCGCAHDIIVTFTSHPGTIKFYKCSSGKLLSVKDIGIYTNSEQMQLIDSYLLYCMFNCMNVLDIHKQEVVYCLEFSFYSFLRRLTVIEPRFVVVWLLERGESPGCPSYYQEVWDMKNLSKKLFQCSNELGFEMVTSSSSIIKQIIDCNGMVHLYTFW